MSVSWQVRAAAGLVALLLVPGAGMLLLALRLLTSDPGLLFAVQPAIAMGLAVAGLYVSGAAVVLSVALLGAKKRTRLQTLLVGAVLVLAGAFVIVVLPWLGALVIGYGSCLVLLMLTSSAASDLGGWTEGLTPRAPWGRTPGTGPWSSEPVQQGPWSPDPTSVPWVGWQGHSGPRPPWWETWQVALARGIPLWEACILGLALVGFGAGILLILLDLGQRRISLPAAVLIGSALGLTWFVERRMRARLSGRE